MKVRIAFTVEVDPAAWSENYGVERGEVRDDVRMYVENAVRAHLDDAGISIV